LLGVLGTVLLPAGLVVPGIPVSEDVPVGPAVPEVPEVSVGIGALLELPPPLLLLPGDVDDEPELDFVP